MSRRSRIRLAVSGLVEVVWFGKSEVYEGRISASCWPMGVSDGMEEA
jgi:hypothetical protein